MQVKYKVRACQVQCELVFHIGRERAIANPHNPTHLLLPTKKHSRLVCVADNLLVCQQRTNLACTCDCNESTLPFQCRILRPWIMSTFTPDGGLFKINHIPMQSMKTKALPQLRNCSNAQNRCNDSRHLDAHGEIVPSLIPAQPQDNNARVVLEQNCLSASINSKHG